MSRQAGSIVREDFKAAPDIRQSGPAAGGGYVLPAQPKVKVRRNRRANDPLERRQIGSVEIKDLAASSSPNQRYPGLSALSQAGLVIADDFSLH